MFDAEPRGYEMQLDIRLPLPEMAAFDGDPAGAPDDFRG